MSATRPTIEVAAAPGGWPTPWPSVAELAEALPSGSWTLVGGLMTQLHTIHHGIGIVRPTNDVDIVLHIETQRGIPNAVATVLEGLGVPVPAQLRRAEQDGAPVRARNLDGRPRRRCG